MNDTSPRDIETLASRIADLLRPEFQVGSVAEPLADRQKMAELASISLPTLDRLVRSGEIPSIRVGSRRLFDPRAVLAALTAKS